MNTREGKIQLIKDIQEGLIDPAELPADPLIISNPDRVFEGMLSEVNSLKNGTESRNVYVGEARKANIDLNETFKTLEIKINEIRES